MYEKIIKWWLVGILLFFPFFAVCHRYLTHYGYKKLDLFFRFVDELTVVVFILLALIELYRKREILARPYVVIGISIIVFCVYGFISGALNNNSIKVTFLGTIDYIKYFFVIFIYAAFFREDNDYKIVYRFLLILAIILAAAAIIEEIWALFFRYALGRDIMDPSVYLLRKPPPSIEQSLASWRFGLFRSASIIRKINWLGYYCLFMFTLYISMCRKVNILYYGTLLGGILVTFSRRAYVGLMMVLGLTIILRKFNKKIVIASFVIISMIFLTIASYKGPDIDRLDEAGQTISYRYYAGQKGMQIWKDHPFIGVGPGMFGGVISKIFVSPVYKEYNFRFGYIKSIGGIDQYWPQLFAEMGLVGVILFVAILMIIIQILFMLRKESNNERKGLITGLLVFMLVIYVYTMGTGFNITHIIFPFFALIGISLGFHIRRKLT